MHILYFFVSLQATNVNALLPNKSKLNNLRDKVISELSYNNYASTRVAKESKILSHKCGMINKDGICYFNAVIQFLLANENMILFYLMNDFEQKQILSITLQCLVYKMLTEKKVDPIPYILIFSKHPRLQNFCTLNGGNPHILLEEMLKGLYMETELNKQMYYYELGPISYFLTEKVQTMCRRCKYKTLIEISNVLVNIPFSNTIEESIKFYKNITKTLLENKYYRCNNCSIFNPIIAKEIKYDVDIPDNFIIVFERVQIKNNVIYSIFQEIELNKTIKIEGQEYVLYSAICSYMFKNGYHANSIVYKDGKWTLFNDDQLETFPNDYTNNKIFNNYAWILYYKKIKVQN